MTKLFKKFLYFWILLAFLSNRGYNDHKMSPDSLHGKGAMCKLKFFQGNLFLIFGMKRVYVHS